MSFLFFILCIGSVFAEEAKPLTNGDTALETDTASEPSNNDSNTSTGEDDSNTAAPPANQEEKPVKEDTKNNSKAGNSDSSQSPEKESVPILPFLAGTILGFLGGFLVGRSKKPEPPKEKPKKRVTITPKKSDPGKKKPTLKVASQNKEKRTPALKFAQDQKPSETSEKTSPKKGITLVKKKSNTSSAQTPDTTPKSLEDYLVQLRNQLPMLSSHSSSIGLQCISFLEESLPRLATDIQKGALKQKESQCTKWRNDELLPMLDLCAQLLSDMLVQVHVHDKASAGAEWLRKWLFQSVAQECTRQSWFEIQKTIPFETPFDADFHQVTNTAQYGFEHKDKVVFIYKIGLVSSNGFDTLQIAEVVVGK